MHLSRRVAQRLYIALRLDQNPWQHTVDEWFALAVEAERIKLACGPFDPAYMLFVQQEMDALKLAELRQDADRFGFTESNTRAAILVGDLFETEKTHEA